jgi:hypothetical protein
MSSVDRWRHKRPIAEYLTKIFFLQWRNSVWYFTTLASQTIAAMGGTDPK